MWSLRMYAIRRALFRFFFRREFVAQEGLAAMAQELRKVVEVAVDEGPRHGEFYVLIRASALTEAADIAFGVGHPVSLRHREKIRIARAVTDEVAVRALATRVLN